MDMRRSCRRSIVAAGPCIVCGSVRRPNARRRMTHIDYILAAVVIISMLFGAIRGFLRESIALLGWLTGLWLAWRYSPLVEPYLGGSIAGTELQTWLARIIVLLAVVTCAWLIG